MATHLGWHYHSLMARSRKKARRLVVGGKTFLWSVRHHHDVEHTHPPTNLYRDCREVVSLRAHGTSGRLLITFRQQPGRVVSDGILPAGIVGTTDGDQLNLYEPGTARALLDEAAARGWNASAATTEQLDGWHLFDAADRRRRGR